MDSSQDNPDIFLGIFGPPKAEISLPIGPFVPKSERFYKRWWMNQLRIEHPPMVIPKKFRSLLASLIAKRDNYICHLCRLPVLRDEIGVYNATADHLIPYSFGGSDDLENRKLSHKSCDTLRGHLHYIEARRVIPMYMRGDMSKKRFKIIQRSSSYVLEFIRKSGAFNIPHSRSPELFQHLQEQAIHIYIESTYNESSNTG